MVIYINMNPFLFTYFVENIDILLWYKKVVSCIFSLKNNNDFLTQAKNLVFLTKDFLRNWCKEGQKTLKALQTTAKSDTIH